MSVICPCDCVSDLLRLKWSVHVSETSASAHFPKLPFGPNPTPELPSSSPKTTSTFLLFKNLPGF